MTDTSELEALLSTAAAKLLQDALRLALTAYPERIRQAETVHIEQRLVPVLSIICGHGDMTRVGVSLALCHPHTGEMAVQLLAHGATAEALH